MPSTTTLDGRPCSQTFSLMTQRTSKRSPGAGRKLDIVFPARIKSYSYSLSRSSTRHFPLSKYGGHGIKYLSADRQQKRKKALKTRYPLVYLLPGPSADKPRGTLSPKPFFASVACLHSNTCQSEASVFGVDRKLDIVFPARIKSYSHSFSRSSTRHFPLSKYGGNGITVINFHKLVFGIIVGRSSHGIE